MNSTDALKQATAVAAENAGQVDIDGAFPAAAVDALRGSGLLGLILPEEVGGLGAGPVEFTEVVGELAAACGLHRDDLPDACLGGGHRRRRATGR